MGQSHGNEGQTRAKIKFFPKHLRMKSFRQTKRFRDPGISPVVFLLCYLFYFYVRSFTYVSKWLKSKRLVIQSVSEDVEKTELSYIAGRNVKMYNYFGKKLISSLKS